VPRRRSPADVDISRGDPAVTGDRAHMSTNEVDTAEVARSRSATVTAL
jgi:hypothetical protein